MGSLWVAREGEGTWSESLTGEWAGLRCLEMIPWYESPAPAQWASGYYGGVPVLFTFLLRFTWFIRRQTFSHGGWKKGMNLLLLQWIWGNLMLQNANVLFPLKVNFLKRLTAASANGKWRSHWIWIEHREHKLILWDGYDSVSVNIKYLFQETGKIDCKLEKDTELTLL